MGLAAQKGYSCLVRLETHQLFQECGRSNKARMKTHLELAEIELMEQAATCIRDKLLIRLLFRLGCRISEALALRVEDIDFSSGNATIVHLKSRLRLFCPECEARLGRAHRFCPACGKMVAETTRKQGEHRRLRTLPVDSSTLTMLKNYVDQGGPKCTIDRTFSLSFSLTKRQTTLPGL